MPEPERQDEPRLHLVPREPEVTEAEERAALLVLARVLLKARERIRREDKAQP